jgi:hypothetical protein
LIDQYDGRAAADGWAYLQAQADLMTAIPISRLPFLFNMSPFKFLGSGCKFYDVV